MDNLEIHQLSERNRTQTSKLVSQKSKGINQRYTFVNEKKYANMPHLIGINRHQCVSEKEAETCIDVSFKLVRVCIALDSL